MKEIDFATSVLHDSAKEQYRSPLGAVTAGDKVRLRLKLRDFPFQKCYLTVLTGEFNKLEIEMHRDGEGYMSAEYRVPDYPFVVWYYFTLHLDPRTRIYYGPEPGWRAGVGQVYWSPPPAFQLTVVARGFETPDWFKGGVMYQIFPDRFRQGDPEQVKKGFEYHLARGRHFRMHDSWDETPEYLPVPGEKFYQPSDFFGGDLQGIINGLDYMSTLGVTALYLNPIFEGASNHRYNTADYMTVDPILGTNETFEKLAEEARGRGIRIILDGVFSHTGADSVYFNKDGTYDSVGAYQSKQSPYYQWYTFFEFPDKYRAWWGFETLPEVDETKPDWIDFIIRNANSVVNTWLDRGASGYRLDVADELPDETIQLIRQEIKAKDPQDVLVGEVWEDATTKESYGVTRKYALGTGLDSVMNYPFLDATVAFLTNRIDAYAYKRFLVSQSQNYPKQMYYALMNILSTHDVARIRTLLATHVEPHDLPREKQAHFVVTPEQDEVGGALQKLAAAVQFSIPGCPCIYYGDEVGMNGLLDPFNRMPFKENDVALRSFYQKIARLRDDTDAMKTGWCAFSSRSPEHLAILRWIIDGQDAFGRPGYDGMYVTMLNRADSEGKVVVDLYTNEEMMTADQHRKIQETEFTAAHSVLTDVKYTVDAGLVTATLPARTCDILKVHFT